MGDDLIRTTEPWPVNDYTEPMCPKCGSDLVDTARHKPMEIEGRRDLEVTAVWCKQCSALLAFLPR